MLRHRRPPIQTGSPPPSSSACHESPDCPRTPRGGCAYCTQQARLRLPQWTPAKAGNCNRCIPRCCLNTRSCCSCCCCCCCYCCAGASGLLRPHNLIWGAATAHLWAPQRSESKLGTSLCWARRRPGRSLRCAPPRLRARQASGLSRCRRTPCGKPIGGEGRAAGAEGASEHQRPHARSDRGPLALPAPAPRRGPPAHLLSVHLGLRNFSISASLMYSPVSSNVALLSARSSSSRWLSVSVRLVYQMGAPMPNTRPSTQPATDSCVSGSEKSRSMALHGWTVLLEGSATGRTVRTGAGREAVLVNGAARCIRSAMVAAAQRVMRVG
jgi:hypothetical protein